MGNQLCPGNAKDFIQGFRELQKGQKQYHPFFQCCVNYQAIQPQEIFVDFQEKDHQNPFSTLENSNIEGQTLKREANQSEAQLFKQKNGQKQQVQQSSAKEVIDKLFPDGWRYKGEAVASVPEGKGQEYGPNGEHFTGHFVKGTKEGLGTYKFADGSVYEGEFKENMMWGFGRFYFSNGDSFQGEFVKNVREGKGKYSLHQPNLEDLLFFEGEYRNDLKNGPGYMKYVGSQVHGIWKDGIYDYSFE